MAITPLPTPAPDINDPATFAARATAQAAAFPVLVSEINSAMLSFGPGDPVCTVGGTANAQTLTSGINITALIAGQRVVFKAPATNTGSTTINLDGRGAVVAKTPTGADLPAGYIRTDVYTWAIYDGTNWIVSRAPEIGSNANGNFLRLENGYQKCWRGQVNSSASAATTWTFPAAFASNPAMGATVVSASLTIMAVNWPTITASSATFNVMNSSNARVATLADLTSKGLWY